MEYQESGTIDKVEDNGHNYLRIVYDDSTSFGGVWWKQIERHKSPMNIVTDGETKNILEGLWFNRVKKGVIDEPEEDEWKLAALRFGEKLSDIGPGGYYNFTAGEWVEWALNAYEK